METGFYAESVAVFKLRGFWLLGVRLRLNLGTISRHDKWWSTGWRFGDFAGDAYALVTVGSNGLLGFGGLRPERYEGEHRIWFRLIEIEGYGFPVACDSILGNFGVYHFSAYGCGLANVVLGIGGVYSRRWRALSKSKRQQARHGHHNHQRFHIFHL